MSAAAISFRAPVLPWTIAPEDHARFARIRQRVLGVSLIVCVVFPWLPRPVEEPAKPQELAPRAVKLVIERETLLAPPPPVVKKTEPAPHAPPTDLRKQAPEKPATVKNPVPEARNPQPNKPPGEVNEARRKAAGVGLLAMKDDLAELRGAPLAVQLKPENIKQVPGVGSGVGVGVGAGNEPGLPARAMITSNAAGSSGGINTAAYSRNTGGGGLAGRATTLVEGVAGGGGGAGGGGVRANGTGTGTGTGGGTGTGSAGGTLAKSGSGKASRSIEEIKLVFERNKGAIYAIYNRALREEPSLQGKVVLELKIAPSGEVVGCRLVSSELHAAELEAKLLARIRQFEFSAKDVEQMVVTWPVDFLPS
jgi:TonB family protein